MLSFSSNPLKVFTYIVLATPLALWVGQSHSSVLTYDSAFHCQGDERFNWYCIEKKDDEPSPAPLPAVPLVPPVTVEDEIDKRDSYEKEKLAEFEAMQQRLENLKRIAIVEPSDENLRAYIAYQLEMQKKAALFADKWKRVQWASPELDYSVAHPTNNTASRLRKEERRASEMANLESLASDGWAIWFFYSSTCNYCHSMIDPLNMLHNKNGLPVLPVSLDGGLLPELNALPFQVDSGQAQQLGVTITPTIFLVNTKSNDVIPISFGVISYFGLIERIYNITQTEPGERF